MFMHLTIHGIKAWRASDNSFDPFDNSIELYQTWHLSELEPLAPMEAQPTSLGARLGFSLRGAPSDGVRFRNGETRIVVDPQITFGLSDKAFTTGQRSRYVIDYYHWESDKSTETVRTAFSNPTLDRLLKVWKAAGEDEAKARAQLEAWMKDNGENLLKAALSAAGVAASPWVMVGTSILPIINLLMNVARRNGDDFIDAHRFVMEIEGAGAEDKTRWRVIPPSGAPSPWVQGQGKQDFAVRAQDGQNRNVLDVRYVFRMID